MKYAKLATILMVVMAMALLVGAHVGNASAATQRTSTVSAVDLNNLVCKGGVPTKAKLLYYARGGKDPCGRTVNKIWAAMGITYQVAKTMHLGTICASGGWISSGHLHSPDPAKDKRHVTDGQVWYSRPLSVWGNTCYRAWIGWTEDGHEVAVLEGCGNGEFHKLPPHHKHHKHHKPKPPTPQYACVNTSVTPTSIQVGQSVSATTTYSESGGASFQSVSYSWGDSTTTTGGTTSSHTYNTAGTYTVVATVYFHLPNGHTKSATAPACQGSVTVTPPPPPPPGLSCTAPQEITGGNSVIVKCDVTDGNGAPISLNATSQDSNSQVTGINCYSQGGSPSCHGDGQFEFRVNGFNDTSGVLTTTVKVVAYANGLWSQPVYMTFNVDPSGGGF